MITLYTLLAVLYVACGVGFYKLYSREKEIKECYLDHPTTTMLALVLCSCLWVFVVTFSHLMWCFKK